MTDIAANSRVKKIESLKLIDVGKATKAGTAFLIFENVTVRFNDVLALDGLSLEICGGEIAALIGPEGAGKTTVFDCITGICEPTGGRILLNGKTIAGNYPKSNKKQLNDNRNSDAFQNKAVKLAVSRMSKLGIARINRNVCLDVRLTVYENALKSKNNPARRSMFNAPPRAGAGKTKNVSNDIISLLKEHNLSQYMNETPDILPYAIQRRLEIAAALTASPSLLLLDEPAADMELGESIEWYEYIRRVRDRYKLTVIIIERTPGLAVKIADRVFALDKGKLISQY